MSNKKEVEQLPGEENAPLQGVKIHDLVSLQKIKRTNGEYSWGEHEYIGVVMTLSPERMKIKLADLDEEEYVPAELDQNYYYRIGAASEIEYMKQITEAIDKQMKDKEKAIEKAAEIDEWRETYKYSISVLGRMATFIKSFVNQT